MLSEEISCFGGRIREITRGSASLELETVVEKLNSLEDVSRPIVDQFSNVSRSIGVIRFTI